ncbi:MAG: hypothetical protein EHM86_00080 [Desulfobulbaceae bacterium]|nr:MAG: hypothetical protein EHM86_10445 [Desulfobulbaceae bacterium]RPH44189.1 MAG: hypothetical protein EHM86_00080 [Desulfobulbaceae bacterium]
MPGMNRKGSDGSGLPAGGGRGMCRRSVDGTAGRQGSGQGLGCGQGRGRGLGQGQRQGNPGCALNRNPVNPPAGADTATGSPMSTETPLLSLAEKEENQKLLDRLMNKVKMLEIGTQQDK